MHVTSLLLHILLILGSSIAAEQVCLLPPSPEMLKVVVTGGTGNAGSEVIRQALANPNVSSVISISRRAPPIEPHPKLTVLIHSNFTDYSPILPQLQGISACLWCLGVSTRLVTPQEYETLTYDYALAAAKAMAPLAPPGASAPFRFLFLSGEGADSTEKSSMLFARVKGRTENALFALQGMEAYALRPAFIHPSAPRPAGTPFMERFFDKLAPLFYKLAPKYIIPAADLGKAMLRLAAHGSDKRILDNTDLKGLAHVSA